MAHEEQFETPAVQIPSQEEAPKYHPRWAARVGLVIVLIAVALYYYHIASGGMR